MLSCLDHRLVVYLQASIVQKEGVGALFKGCLVRACWTAPLGAFNFAGACHYLDVTCAAEAELYR